MDYQNIHLTARDQFTAFGTPPKKCLIDPGEFAEHVMARRAERQGDPIQKRAGLTAVKVYRGQPSNLRQPGLYTVTQRQRSQWTRDKRVEVFYRTLRYPASWPEDRAQEKGIDVQVALTVVRLGWTKAFDVIILASHDTDMEPALEMAASDGGAKIETCGWEGCRRLRARNRPLWHTELDEADFKKCIDNRPYDY